MRYGALFLLLFLIVSCKKETIETSSAPVIEFKEFINYNNDSADCVIYFKDADGDVGIPAGDIGSEDDYTLKYLYKDTNGDFVAYDATFGTPEFDTLFYSYRVADLSEFRTSAGLEGEIIAKLRSNPWFFPTHKSIKFEIKLEDRAGNVSNTVTTEEIILIP